MVEQFRAPIGTRDILPPESRRWESLIARFVDHATRAGYGLVQSPMFEDLAVFQRVGEGTDVVTKEMYDFEDKGGRRIALRPEGTASVVRAFNQHHPLTPWKAYYVAPSFRYEAPQAGRFRQHHQLGAEVLGTTDPDVDVEVITLLWDFYAGLGLTRIRLRVNNLGDTGDRRRYMGVLSAYLLAHEGDLAEEDRAKAATHPMRVLDSKRRETRAVVADAPALDDHVSDASADHVDRVRAGLGSLGVDVEVDPLLVRGLDYYTRTTFEFAADALDNAQNAVGGGGRYDGLAEDLGGRSTPGIGFGAGIERILLACDAEATFPAPASPIDVFVVDVTDGTLARDLTHQLRRAGLGADRAFDGRSMKSQMKAADRSGAALALIVGDDERAAGKITVRHLRGRERHVRAAESGGQPQELVELEAIVDHVRDALGH